MVSYLEGLYEITTSHRGLPRRSPTLQQGDVIKRQVLGGDREHPDLPYYAPTLLTDVTPNMVIAQEEIFGPVATVISFTHEEEAIHIANDTPFGLAAYFYTQDLARIFRVAEKLDYGMVGINEGIISTVAAPFGGVKASGLGREGSYQGIEEYLDTQYLCLGI